MVNYDHIWSIRPNSWGSWGSKWVDFRAPETDELGEMHQLNGLFLRLLQQAGEAGQAALGFPPQLLRLLVELDSAQLQRAAGVPRCLFSLSLDGDHGQPAPLPTNAWEGARRSFAQAALYSAWTAARRSSAVARALYGLSAIPVRRLRTMGIADLVAQATHTGVVSCGFDAVPGVWHALLGSPTQPLPRTLVLTLIAADRQAPTVPTPAAAATRHALVSSPLR